MLGELAGRLERRRVGLRVLEGAPAREGAEIVDETRDAVVGTRHQRRLLARASRARSPWATCRRRSPSPARELGVVVRGKTQAAEVVPMPFVPHRYHRKPSTKEPS